MVWNNTCKCMPTLCKNAYGLVYVRLFNCAAPSLPRKLLWIYLESCANIVQAVVYCPPYRPPSCQQSVARRVCSRNPSKSTLAHDAVATAVLHTYHLIIRVGTGLIQFVYRSHLRLATGATRNRNALSPFFARVSIYDDDCFYYHTWRNNVVIAIGTLSSFLTSLQWVVRATLSIWKFMLLCIQKSIFGMFLFLTFI